MLLGLIRRNSGLNCSFYVKEAEKVLVLKKKEWLLLQKNKQLLYLILKAKVIDFRFFNGMIRFVLIITTKLTF